MPDTPAIPCQACPLRALPLFLPHTADELLLVESLKRRETQLAAGGTLIHEGQTDAPLYTLLSGWGLRYKTLSDGRRQILSFLLAGDCVGVQQKMGDAAAHGVDMLTDARLCVFQRDALWELHRQSPTMGFNITWLTAHEESRVDDTLLSVGRRSAEERIAMLLIKRAAVLQADGGAGRRLAAAVHRPVRPAAGQRRRCGAGRPAGPGLAGCGAGPAQPAAAAGAPAPAPARAGIARPAGRRQALTARLRPSTERGNLHGGGGHPPLLGCRPDSRRGDDQ